MIIKKLIKKDVQLLYSGTGRKIRGQRKKSFQETESYKCLNGKLQKKINKLFYFHDDKNNIFFFAVNRFLDAEVYR